jgi:glycosyltransferase involved in cell wall biosynthesis
MGKLNVLFLNSWYPNKLFPYNGNFIQQHARAVALNCNVACLQVEVREQKELFEVFEIENEGVLEVIVYAKKVKNNLLFVKKAIRRHKGYKLGLKLIKEKFPKIDITHLNVILPAGLFALYLQKKFKTPYIITEHSTIYLKISGLNYSFLEKILLKKVTKKASKICPVSYDLKEAMISSGYIGDYEVIPNVVNTKYFKFKERAISKPIKILHVSSLKEEHKNGKGILRVIKQLYKKRQDFTFTIISDGDLLPIKKYANKIDLKPNFFYIKGGKTIKEIAQIMQNFDLFLLFSNYENLPCVISESLVSGMPVISSDVGGIKEMITKENGILVTAKKEDELLLSLDKTLDNLSKFNRKEIAEKAKEKYSYLTVGNQFLSIYKEIIKA